MEIPFQIWALLGGCTLFLAFAGWIAYEKSGDILHPAIFLSFLFFAGMVVEPWQRLSHPEIGLFFPGFKGVAWALLIQYLGVVALFAGLLSVKAPRGMHRRAYRLLEPGLSGSQRERLRTLAWIVGGFAVFAFWLGIFNVGGLTKAYGYAKGMGRTGSGYLGEAQNLGFAAVVMYALGTQRSRFDPARLAVMFFFISPTLIQGTLGGRRGPLFISLIALFAGWCLMRGRMPKLLTLAAYFGLTLAAVVFVQSQRQHLHLGADEATIDLEKFQETLRAEEIGPGDNFMVSTGTVMVSESTDSFHYGRRFFIIFLIRPIPRQIWPDKYEDVSSLLYGGSGDYYENIAILSPSEWLAVLGWQPPEGYATNSAVDLYSEFRWLYLPAEFLLGRFLGVLWFRFRTRGQIWTILFLASAVLSIYLPTQSFSAFMHRFLFIAAGSWVFWRVWLKSSPTGRRRVRGTRRQRQVGPGHESERRTD